ncbi:MAG: glutamate synthase, partial [Myxococcales bacterium]|nr:glutamate synthase [Myxococcales bacterium]
MAELVPYPFGRLARRIFREFEERGSILDLPERKFVRGVRGADVSVRMHGRRASTALGPAAGPHSQLAQNIVLAFLGGGRIFELKTVQILDQLQIPRPCIDMQTIGYNVEWSQELRLEQSLEEYVKASMLLEILIASGKLELEPGFADFIFDMSVGYDLAGIQSERVRAFIEGLLDATPIIDRLRSELPEELAQYRDLDFRSRVSETLTLSTFHGCPPEEIERIIHYLLNEHGLHCVAKLNPTLLGRERVAELLGERMGYPDRVPDVAFEKDTKWEQALEFTERLGAEAERLGLGFGVKFSNTLIVQNHRDFFPATEKEMYLSGAPLHVLAMELVARF